MRVSFALTLALVFVTAASAQSFVPVEAFQFELKAPVELAVAPEQPDRFYIVEQGVVGPDFIPRVLTMRRSDAVPTTFLDLSGRVLTGGEQGLLGLAFHPEYASNGRVFVSYIADNPRRSVISEFARSTSDPLTANSGSEQVILEVPQFESNHNGGQITFGPDGYLYIGLGDGGGADDPGGHGQDTTTLLGAMLRIDVDTVPEGATYGIPDTNPFAALDGPDRDEIYAYGFRNPWRFAFDQQTDDLWVMDVGQGTWEEVNRVELGNNYGWSRAEGAECFPIGQGCDLSGTEAPVFAYDHSGTGGFSISGGMVYRGAAMPSLQGQVLYADYVSRRVWALDANGTEPDTTLLLTTSGSGIAAVREGPDGEPYLLIHTSGRATRVLRLEQIPVSEEESPSVASSSLILSGPNPFVRTTRVTARLTEGGAARVTLHDALGRELATLFEGTLAPGEERAIPIPGADRPPGLYVVRLVAGASPPVQRRLVRIR